MENFEQIAQTPPQNLDAERSVLGGLLLDPIKYASVAPILNESDFYKVSHQLIYSAIERIYDREGSVDTLMLIDQLDALDQLETVGGQEAIINLAAYVPTTANIEQYAKIVQTKSLLRQLINTSKRISKIAYEESEDIESIIDQSERWILSIGEGSQDDRPRDMHKMVVEAFEKIVKLSEEKKDIVGLPSGYIELDKLTAGFQPDQLIILAARPSVGKTAFALNIAQNVATRFSIPVVIFSLEMNALDMVYRMICAEGNINASNLRTGQLTDDEWSSLTVATDTLKDAPIFIDDSAGIKVSEIRAKCRRLKQENPNLGLIVIDYLQLIDGNGRENRQQEVSEISRQLKKLAKELGVPVLALSQLSRGLEQRQNKRPILSDIRESGSIEQDADIVAFLYRDDYHQKDEEEPDKQDDLPDNVVEVIIAKNRAGARDTVKLLFKKEYNKFSSLSFKTE
ncbi:replicative DNA helicase [Facklamia hominis]|uniref:Replicative DNA helicase n=1 Tax=Facklamia hominis CCUG 36813 TaxID=883111 RepID=K1MFW1_9LACT|nr:replicative DNA helicase [Facklamia hominis]EKB54904.1 replicative DNA helicase [Facklamia hominis CCUG 36813]EPH07605.1 replicative DNA helicase [Facklamia hominis ACS-120-V-Sch10]